MSCEDDPPEPDNSNSIDKGVYLITIDNITTGVKTSLIGEFVDTSWDPATGFIFLNTDDSTSGPIGTITMSVDIPNTRFNSETISSILVSKSDIRKGTAAQLNAQLFEGTKISHDLLDVEIGC